MTPHQVRQLKKSVRHIGAWRSLPFFSRQQQFNHVCSQLRNVHPVLPKPGDIFKAFRLLPDPCDVRVIILGQDPYPRPNHATGLAFSIPNGQSNRTPTTSKNVRRCVRRNYRNSTTQGDLTNWATQGVLLINRALTVTRGHPGSHLSARFGWKPLIKQVLQRLARHDDVVWLLWGREAHAMLPSGVMSPCVIKVSHPSNRSKNRHNPPAYCAFSRSSQFRMANRFLRSKGHNPINW